MQDLTTLKLSELRELYPTIITNSKAKFLVMIKELNGSDTNIEGKQCTEQDENGDISSLIDTGVLGEKPTSPEVSIINSPIADIKEHPIVGGNLPGNDAESIAEARHVMQIRENVPKPLLDELYKMQGCECTADAYAKFRDTPFAVTRAMQYALNNAYYEFFKERVRNTSCSTCIARRVSRIREYLATKIQ